MKVAENRNSESPTNIIISGELAYPKESEALYQYLLNHGYDTEEIKIEFPETEQADAPVVEAEPYVKPSAKTLRRAIRGVRRGIVLGAIAGGLLAAIIVIISGGNFTASSVGIVLAGVGVGIVWGITLGFLLTPQFPFLGSHSTTPKAPRKKVLVRFAAHSMAEARYFIRNWHLNMA
jgi:hypothetical protein